MNGEACKKAVDPWIGDHPAFLAHMNMLQAIIARLSTSSASCKTWCLTLVTTLLALSGSMHAPRLLPLALFPVVLFAFLDANYLSQERWFRTQFGVLATKAQLNEYERAEHLFMMNKRSWAQALCGLAAAFTSWSIWPMYGGLVAAYAWAWDHGLLALLVSATSH